MKNYWTKKECDIIIDLYKNDTAWFGNNDILGENIPMTFESMYDMLRLRMGFGMAESNVIIACLIKCGAKFTK